MMRLRENSATMSGAAATARAPSPKDPGRQAGDGDGRAGDDVMAARPLAGPCGWRYR
jgi:hypothetical protein